MRDTKTFYIAADGTVGELHDDDSWEECVDFYEQDERYRIYMGDDLIIRKNSATTGIVIHIRKER